ASTAPLPQGASPFVPYLPRLVVDWVRDNPDELWLSTEGSVAFVDISGFTKLSERLARHGKIGAEELTDAIGTCFVDLLAVAYANGGSLIKFGGDALLLFFKESDHAERACRAAVGMRRELRELGHLTVLGNRVTLRMSVGIHSGRFNFFLVGDSHRELVVTGPGASSTVAMEQTAEAGEIVVSEATASSVEPSVVGNAKGNGRLLRRAPEGLSTHSPLEAVAEDLDLSICVPRAVRNAVTSSPIAPEHRRVTVAFIKYEGTDSMITELGPASTASELDTLMREVQHSADRHGVAFLGTDIDGNGGKIILTAGAPSTSGDDEHRMLLCLSEILDVERSLVIRAGVNRGAVFAGEIGPHYRRTFTVMGDVVNLAARLMAKAEYGQILATPDVIDRVDADMDLFELDPFSVKGKKNPVRAFAVNAVAGSRPLHRRGDHSRQLPLVGREEELAILTDASGSLGEGRGGFLEVVGDPGIGKSRLVEELQRSLPATCLSVACEPYETTTPYYPFRALLRELVGITPGMEDEEAADKIRAALGEVSDALVGSAPLVGAAVDVRMPETEETALLEERFRPRRLADVTTQLLGGLLDAPTLLVIEDAHWMDEASSDLVRSLAFVSAERPWAIVVVRRDTDSGFVAEEGLGTVIRLGPLSDSDAAELVKVATAEKPISAHIASVLAERSGGNPLFLRELIATALANPDAEELPETIDAVIAARIDQLSPSVRHFLRRVSVLGRSFPTSLLPAVLDDDSPEPAIWPDELGDFLKVETDHVAFLHALVRDSAYDGLPYRLRQSLHARAGDRIRMSAGLHPGEHAGILSLHYFHAHRYHEAWTYSLIAGDRAKELHANVESSEFYERAVESGKHIDELGSEEMLRAWEALGDALNSAGIYARADRAYRSARRTYDGPIVQARLALKLAQVCGWLDRYSGALRWITRGLRTLEAVDAPGVPAQHAQLLAWYGRFCQEEGHHRKAIRWCTAAVEAAEEAGDLDALANALKVLDWASMDLGNLDQPDNWLRALSLFEELGDLPSQASVLNMLGGFAYFEGRWSEALELYRRAQVTVLRTGNDVMDAFCRNNIGEIALEQGQLDEAETEFEEARRIWLASGYRSVAATAVANLGRVACARGQYVEAERLFEDSLRQAQRVGGQTEALEVSARLAECILLSGQVDRAMKLADEGVLQCRALGGVPARLAQLHRVRAAGLMGRGRFDEAGDALEQSLEAGRARNADYEVALTTSLLGEWHRRVGSDQAENLERESNQILDRLGVVWIPNLVEAPSAAKA
ncbi:MAG TPA: adenylate/guanylate cyclase domain-containing protein, partial [Acidimicrobiales bacterium]|nr:adenylate/guanylate cyclase domain-containing protein [Acidimicrobiales bacterium]